MNKNERIMLGGIYLAAILTGGIVGFTQGEKIGDFTQNSLKTISNTSSEVISSGKNTLDSLLNPYDNICIRVYKPSNELAIYKTNGIECSYEERSDEPIYRTNVIVGPSPDTTFYASIAAFDSPKWFDPDNTGIGHEGVFGDFWLPLQYKPIKQKKPDVNPESYSLYAIHGTTKENQELFENEEYANTNSNGCPRISRTSEEEIKEIIKNYSPDANGPHSVWGRGDEVYTLNNIIPVEYTSEKSPHN